MVNLSDRQRIEEVNAERRRVTGRFYRRAARSELGARGGARERGEGGGRSFEPALSSQVLRVPLLTQASRTWRQAVMRVPFLNLGTVASK